MSASNPVYACLLLCCRYTEDVRPTVDQTTGTTSAGESSAVDHAMAPEYFLIGLCLLMCRCIAEQLCGIKQHTLNEAIAARHIQQ